MLKFTPCADAPLLKAGIPVDSLYFTKAPGEKYLSVFARYKNNSDWVPLHIGLPAVPTLQQVRDTDPNIAMNSGSYDDAHLYLRSAAGSNMTAAYYTNAAGAAIQAGNTEDFAPLNLQPEGGLLTYNGVEVATQDWVNDMALVRKNDIVTDFNTVTQAGIYNIPYNLSLITHYPHIGNNNNGASSGMLVVYNTGATLIQYFYPNNETMSMNRSGGFWYRRGIADAWEYKNGILEINLKTPTTTVQANDLNISGEYLIAASNTTQYANAGFPDSGATFGGIPFMLTVRKRWGNAPWGTFTTQELVSMQESALNLTRKWIRSKFNWQGENAHAWDAWNEVGLLRDVYTRTQLNTSGSGGHVHWDNIDSKPTIVSTETDPTVPAHVKAITQAYINAWNAKEDAANKSTNIVLGNSNTLYPSQNAVKSYVDNAITSNNTGFIPVTEKGTANGIATLGANGKIPNTQIPALAITETFPVNSEAEMLALTADTGDVAVRNDISKSFILKNAPASLLSNWIELKSPSVSNTDQVPEGTQNLYFTNARSRNAISPAAPLTYNAGTGAIGIFQAGSSSNGYLSTTDWNTFSNKQNALGFTPENITNKATSLASPNNATYPTTQAVTNAISAAAANLQQTTDHGNTTTNALIVTGSEGREVKTYIPASTPSNTIISGSTFKWYNDLVTLGAIRSATSTVEGFGIDINGNRRLTLDSGGNLNAPGKGDFGEVISHNSISAFNTQPYTSGAKFLTVWNGSTGRFEYTDEVFLKTETDPVYMSQEGYIVKTRRSYYGNGSGITMATAGNETGFAYSDGSDNANINGPFISGGQLGYDNDYLMQLLGSYSDGTSFKIRTRNGDINTWNPWRRIYTDADNVLTTVPSLNDVSNVGNTIIKSGANFNNPNFKISKPDGTLMYAHFWVDENGFSIQPGNTATYHNTIINPISGKVGVGINPVSVSDKLAIGGSVFVSTGNGPAINFEGSSHIDRYNGMDLNIVTNGLYWNSELIATRAWINTSTIQNQNTAAQTANTWINGENKAGSFKAIASNREIRTYFSPTTPVSTLVGGTEYVWYNDKVAIGAVRGGNTDIEALGIEFNGTRSLTVYPGGSVNGSGTANFSVLNAQNYLVASNTPQYTSGFKLSSIWNGTTGRYEYVLDQDTNFTMKAAGGEINSVIYKDTRNDNPAPNTRNGGLWWDFKTPAAVGLPAGGLYAGVLTLSPYHDNSGLDNGANVSQIATYYGKLLHRSGTSVSTWGNWQTIATFEDLIASGMFLQNQFSSAQPANAWIGGDLRLSGMGNGFGNMVMIDGNGTLKHRTFPQFAIDASGSIIQNQFGAAQSGNIWINGAVRAGRFDLVNGQNITWGGGYNPGIPTISAATGTGITFYPNGSNGINGGLQVTFPASGSIKVEKLVSGTTNMVVANSNGVLDIQPIPGTQDQWQDIQSYNYLSAASPIHGTGRGIDTSGGFAAMGRKISGLSYAVQNDDYILLFTDKAEVALPDPNAFPGRILKLRASQTGPISFRDYIVKDFDEDLGGLEARSSMEIQSVNSEWCLVMAGN
jgi:hypothetical protein